MLTLTFQPQLNTDFVIVLATTACSMLAVTTRVMYVIADTVKVRARCMATCDALLAGIARATKIMHSIMALSRQRRIVS